MIRSASRSHASSLNTKRSMTPKTTSQKAVLNHDPSPIGNPWSPQNLGADRIAVPFRQGLDGPASTSVSPSHIVLSFWKKLCEAGHSSPVSVFRNSSSNSFWRRGKPGRGLDLDLDHHVAMAAAVQHRHSGAALAQLLARLDPGRDLDLVHRAVEPGHLDRPAERGGGDADRAAREQGRAVALEDRMAGEVDEDVEIAVRAAAHSGLALALTAGSCVPSSTPGGILTSSERLFSARPSPRQRRAGIGDDLAGAAAGRADPLDDEEALVGADLAAAVARGAAARRWCRAWRPCPRTARRRRWCRC